MTGPSRFSEVRINGGECISFNATPLIDIVFLLIIFFLVVCQFVEARHPAVALPDSCSSARSRSDSGIRAVTLTMMRESDGQITCAVGGLRIPVEPGSPDPAVGLSKAIDDCLKDLPPDQQVVALRIDGDITFGHAQYALTAAALSEAHDVQLIVLRDKASTDSLAQNAFSD